MILWLSNTTDSLGNPKVISASIRCIGYPQINDGAKSADFTYHTLSKIGGVLVDPSYGPTARTGVWGFDPMHHVQFNGIPPSILQQGTYDEKDQWQSNSRDAGRVY